MEQKVKTAVRMPPNVRDWFRGYAKLNNRSMNSQMLSILRGVMDGQRMGSDVRPDYADGRSHRGAEA